MKISKSISIICAGILAQAAPLFGAALSNNKYSLTVPTGSGLSDYSISVDLTATGDPGNIVPVQTLKPEFIVLFVKAATAPDAVPDPSPDADNPLYDRNLTLTWIAPSGAVLWRNNTYQVPKATLEPTMNTIVSGSNSWPTMTKRTISVTDGGARVWTTTPYPSGGSPSTFSGTYAQGTTFPFYVGTNYVMTPANATLSGTTVTYTYPYSSSQPFQLTATLNLAAGDADPSISYTLTPKAVTTPSAYDGGYYSVSFTGMPLTVKSNPLVPQDVLHTNDTLLNHVMPEQELKLPRVQVSGGTTASTYWGAALMVDPAFSAFSNPDGTPRRIDWEFARFGMMMAQVDEDAWPLPSSQVRPYSFAPLMGGEGSYMKSTYPAYNFSLRYVQQPGYWTGLQAYLAGLYGLTDQRDNTGTGSLNKTFDRIMAFLGGTANANNYAMWDPEQKYYDYFCDQPGTFKTFGGLYGLSAAIVTDNYDFYMTRALPHLEYNLSRTTQGFLPYDMEDTAHQGAGSRTLGGSFLTGAELSAIYNIYQRRTYAFGKLIDDRGAAAFSTADFAQLLAKYNYTTSVTDYNAAVAKAKAKITATGGGAANWAFAQDWLDLYGTPIPAGASADATTYRPQFLDSAHGSIYEWLSHNVVLSPSVPAGNSTHDPGGVAPFNDLASGRMVRWGYPNEVGYPILPDRLGAVPAWRIALNGLPSSGSNRGEFWLDSYGRLLRLAALKNDALLRNVGRWGMVGRFATYPGDNRAVPSLVCEDPNLIEKPIWTQTFTTMNPGHAWEFAGEVLDFLISDFYYTSNQRITFPWRSMKGAEFPVAVYGDRPGTFYENPNVRLWMPAGLFTLTDSSGVELNPSQIDYIAGYGTGADSSTLYVAFVNRSPNSKSFKAIVNTSRVSFPTGSAKRWLNNVATYTTTTITTANQTPYIALTSKGIVAFAISGATFQPRPLHDKMFDPTSPTLSAASYQTATFSSPYTNKDLKGMLLSLGKGLTTGYLYSTAAAADTISVSFSCVQSGGPTYTLTDKIFPYEFSFPYNEALGPVTCTVTLKGKNSTTYATSPSTLTLQP